MSGTFCYSGFGLTIACELELPELPPGVGEPDLVIRLGRVAERGRVPSLDEEVAVNTQAGAFRLTGGREIVVDPKPHGDPQALRVVLLGRIMAFLLRQRGWLPLHASAVVLKGRAVLFLGVSGAGKSTTAAAFHTCGHLVIADDVAAVQSISDQCVVLSAWSRLRLHNDSGHLLSGLDLRSEYQVDKDTWDLGNGQLRKLYPVDRIYHLDFGDDLKTERVAPVASAALLSKTSFARHHRQGREAMEIHLRACASVAGLVPMFRLERPRDLASLNLLVRLVESQVCGERLTTDV